MKSYTLVYLYFGLIPRNVTSNSKTNKSNYSDIAKQNIWNICFDII